MTPETSPESAPLHLDLKRDQRLTIQWRDGTASTYPLDYLRAQCPCAACKERRAKSPAPAPAAATRGRKSLSLNVLPAGAADGPPTVRKAELVGNYALRIDWSDGHGAGIYSFQHLRDIRPELNA